METKSLEGKMIVSQYPEAWPYDFLGSRTTDFFQNLMLSQAHGYMHMIVLACEAFGTSWNHNLRGIHNLQDVNKLRSCKWIGFLKYKTIFTNVHKSKFAFYKKFTCLHLNAFSKSTVIEVNVQIGKTMRDSRVSSG